MIIDENIQHYLECNDCGGPAIVVILRSTNGYPILRSWSFCLTSCHIIAKFSTPRRTYLLMFNQCSSRAWRFWHQFWPPPICFDWRQWTWNSNREMRSCSSRKSSQKRFQRLSRSSSSTAATTTTHHKYGTRSKAWWKRGTCSVPRFDQGEHDFGHRFGLEALTIAVQR